ncbi:MAG: rRNA pseudouridine synthase [Clostridia bacterium]|nr:rRNA pseudouridine synthase [Clostridia bacterium]
MMQRLDKIICSQSMKSRRETDGLIRRGRVTVNGEICRRPATHIDPDVDEIAIDGTPLPFSRYVYFMLNKPAGILCVSRDPKAKTVVDLLSPDDRRRDIFPAGRLDRDTHGLVLLTNDGELAHRILSPKHHIPKRYLVRLDGPIGQAEIKAIETGPVLADGTKCLPAHLTVLQDGGEPLVEITIFEGKFHQIKRMFGTVDRGVTWLKRVSMGGLTLDDTLQECEYRSLGKQEISLLFKGC